MKREAVNAKKMSKDPNVLNVNQNFTDILIAKLVIANSELSISSATPMVFAIAKITSAAKNAIRAKLDTLAILHAKIANVMTRDQWVRTVTMKGNAAVNQR